MTIIKGSEFPSTWTIVPIGNAVRSVDNINHSFSIHDNIAYLNENVRLTARYQGLAQEVTLKVVKEKV